VFDRVKLGAPAGPSGAKRCAGDRVGIEPRPEHVQLMLDLADLPVQRGPFGAMNTKRLNLAHPLGRRAQSGDHRRRDRSPMQ
jgi:hypothetical protein